MDGHAELEAFHPCGLRAVPEQVRVAAPVWQGAEIGEITSQVELLVMLSISSTCTSVRPSLWPDLENEPRYIRGVRCSRKCSEIAVSEDRSIDDLGNLEVKSFGNNTAQVEALIVDFHDVIAVHMRAGAPAFE